MDPVSEENINGTETDLSIKLLRALALGGKRSVEIQFILDGGSGENADFQKLALVLTGLSVPRKTAQYTLQHLIAHRAAMEAALARPVKIKTAAMDCLENLGQEHQPGPELPDLSYDQLAEMAFHDDLTKLFNYRSFCGRLTREVQRASRYRHLFSLLMIDIDHFKAFNDHHGHDNGNKALVHIAKILGRIVRDTDLVARYGGEEFAIIMPETPKHTAALVAESLRAAVESEPISITNTAPKTLTISLGLATFPRDAHDSQSLISRADESLYISKQEGRNRLRSYEPHTRARLFYRPHNPNAAQSVHVVGEFNGWDKKVDPMHRRDDGTFTLEIALAPGRYLFKFVINGEFYIADPRAVDFVHDGFGGRNSVLIVDAESSPP